MKTTSPRALVLLSGGLDSMLAAKILMEQGVNVTGLTFQSHFFGPDKANEAAKQLGIPLKIIDFSSHHLQVIRKPTYGYGKAANPCIDCHLLMLKKAKEIADKQGFDFVATGEVLGERPFSQNKQALALIAEKSGLGKKLLRPLSAQLLPETFPEKQGLVDRKKLLAIKGRNRKIQISLAEKFDLNYPQPAGGCILTEKEFAKKLFELFKIKIKISKNDISLLSTGRHFWSGVTRIVLGRNKEENEKLEELKQKTDLLISPENFPGPTALLRGGQRGIDSVTMAKRLIASYSPKISSSPKFKISQRPN